MVSAVFNSSLFSTNGLIAALGSARVAPGGAASKNEKAARVDGPRDGQATEAPPSLNPEAVGKSELTEEERVQVEDLEKRDAEVRRHEQAHQSAAGQYARGGASFEYQTGPDGKRYAIGGEVQIDTSPIEGNPDATIQKMQQVRRAALAPAKPSSQDRQVAADAAAKEQQAKAEQAKQQGGDRQQTPQGNGYEVALRQQTANPAGRFIDVAA